MATVVIIVSTSAITQTYSVPIDYQSAGATAEAIAGGGASEQAGSTQACAGAGAAYAILPTPSLTPGGTASFQIGLQATGSSGGVGASGVDTWFISSATLLAKAGAGGNGNATSGTASLGGAAASCIPSTGAFSGGNGAGNGSGTNFGGLGGGGAAGPNGAGKNGAAGTGTFVGGCGGGGAGGGSSTAGVNGGALNGGAGGTAQDNTAGGAAGTSGNPGTAGGAGVHGSGGGGGGANTGTVAGNPGGNGGNGVEWISAGAGGGGGGAGGRNGTPETPGAGGNGGLYGGGGGGGGFDGAFTNGAPGNGGQGLIVLTYNPAAFIGWTSEVPDKLQLQVYTGMNVSTKAMGTAPIGIAGAELIFPDKWLPSYPDHTVGKRLFQEGIFVSPWGNIAVPIFADKWTGDYPAQVPALPPQGLHTGSFAVDLGVFTQENINLDKWQPRYPDTTRGKIEFQAGVYVSGQVIEIVTADKWYPTYPASTKGKVEFQVGYFAYDFGIATVENTVVSKWYPRYDVRVPQRQLGAFPQGYFAHVPFNLPVIVLPDKWFPHYVDKVQNLLPNNVNYQGDFAHVPLIINMTTYKKTCDPTEAPVVLDTTVEMPHDCGTVTVVVYS